MTQWWEHQGIIASRYFYLFIFIQLSNLLGIIVHIMVLFVPWRVCYPETIFVLSWVSCSSYTLEFCYIFIGYSIFIFIFLTVSAANPDPVGTEPFWSDPDPIKLSGSGSNQIVRIQSNCLDPIKNVINQEINVIS